jgi:hypothetical protein
MGRDPKKENGKNKRVLKLKRKKTFKGKGVKGEEKGKGNE